MTTTRTAPEGARPRTAKAQFDRWAKRHGLKHNSDALIRAAEIDDEIDAYAANKLMAAATPSRLSILAAASQIREWTNAHNMHMYGPRLSINEMVERDEVDAYAADGFMTSAVEAEQNAASAAQISVWLMRHGDDGCRLVTIQASIEKDEQYAYLEDARRATGTLPPVEPGRAERIAQIRELADWLEANPGIPCPTITANAHLQRSVVPDDGERAQRVRDFALATGAHYYELGQHRYAKLQRSPGVEYCFATSSDAGPLPDVEAVPGM